MIHRPLLAALALPLALTAAPLFFAGCPGETGEPSDAGADTGADAPHPGCHLAFIGDPSKELELELIALTEIAATGSTGASVAVKDGDSVALLLPPQGGRVIFAGARARNIDPCGVKLSGYLRDETTKQVRLDIRNVNLEATADGWGRSSDGDISSYSNIPVCGNQWSKTNIYGTEYELSVALLDRGGRTATRSVKVVPKCVEPENLAECTCICKGGYIEGEPCDGGAEGGP